MSKKLDEKYIESIDPEVQRRASSGLMFFIKSLKIPSGEGPLRYSQCMKDFQRETFEALAPSLEAVRIGNKPPIRRFWIERTKKSGKDSDLAACLLWLMAFPIKPLKIQVCAANSKQAGIIRNRVVELAYYNPWLDGLVEIMDKEIRHRSRPEQVWTRIEATDSTGAAHGETPDVLVLNELVHVDKWKAMEDHMANADGVPRGIVIISTNAGIRGTQAHLWKQTAASKPDRWKMLLWNEVAPWINPEDVEEARRRDPIGSEFRRLWKGQWVSGTGGAVDDEDIERCFVLEGPLKGPEPGYYYLAGLDLGVSHDHAGIAVLGVSRREGRMKVVHIKGFKPSIMNDQGKLEVDLMRVEEEAAKVSKVFRVSWFGYDPAAGGSFMAQRLSRVKGVPMRKVNFSSPTIQTQMATEFVKVLKDSKLEAYDDKEGRLRRDFSKFTITHKVMSGYKLESTSDEFGHADVGVALIMTLPRAVEELGGWGGLEPEDVIASTDDASLTTSEVDRMPPELRDIYLEIGKNLL